VHVDDVVRAVVGAGDRLAEGWQAERPLNVGTGRQTTVLELIEGLARCTGTSPEVEHAPDRGGEVRRIAIDPARAGRELGWRPEVELGAGLAGTYEALAAERA